MRALEIGFLAAGAFSIIYFVAIIAYAGIRTAFAPFWLLVGIAGVAVGLALHFWIGKGQSLPGKVLILVWAALGAAILVFGAIEGRILSDATKKPTPEVDYVIVLGAQVRGTQIARTLRYRLEAALIYLEENPQAKVIVSGGQGSGEDISEAEAMQAYLMEHGISQERILLEDKSVNTAENIRFSKEILEADWKGENRPPTVAIATSSFHIYRALRIAKKQGLEQVSGIPAQDDPVLAFSYYMREGFAVMKDFLVGNL